MLRRVVSASVICFTASVCVCDVNKGRHDDFYDYMTQEKVMMRMMSLIGHVLQNVVHRLVGGCMTCCEI